MIYFFLLLTFFIFCYDSDYYYPKWLLLGLFLVYKLSEQIFKIDEFGAILFFYYSASSFFISTSSIKFHRLQHGQTSQSVDLESLRSFSFLTTLVSVGLFLETKTFFDILPFVAIACALLSCFDFLLDSKRLKRKVGTRLPSGNRSVNSTLLSLLGSASLISTSEYSIAAFFCCLLPAIILNKGAAGTLALFASGFYYFRNYEAFTYAMFVFYSLFSVDLFVTNKFIDKRFFADNGRLDIYKFCYDGLIKKNWNFLFGIGAGTFSITMPYLQAIYNANTKGKKHTQFFTWLHNDVLQFITEAGTVGVVIALFFVSSLFLKSFLHANEAYTAFFLAFFVNAVFNFPMRMAPDSLLFVMSLKAMNETL